MKKTGPLARLTYVSFAWSALLLLLHASGREAHGVPPMLADHYYALEAVFVLAVMLGQWRIGVVLLRRRIGESSSVASANALVASTLVLVALDLVSVGARLMLGHGFGALPAMLAPLAALFVLWRHVPIGLALATWIAQALPALLLLR